MCFLDVLNENSIIIDFIRGRITSNYENNEIRASKCVLKKRSYVQKRGSVSPTVRTMSYAFRNEITSYVFHERISEVHLRE